MVERDWRIAIHEAGHATVARLLRLPACGEARVIEPAHAHFSVDHGPRSICALMAGACAEAVAFGEYDRDGIRVDAERVRERLKRHGYDDGGEALWNWTVDVVRQQRPLITRLAVKLARARVLDGPSIDRIVWRG